MDTIRIEALETVKTDPCYKLVEITLVRPLSASVKIRSTSLAHPSSESRPIFFRESVGTR